MVDEQILFIMAHRVAKIYILHALAMTFKLMHNYPVKVLIVHGIVRAKSSGIIVIDNTVVGMGRIVCAEVPLLLTQAHEKPPYALQESQCVRRLKKLPEREGLVKILFYKGETSNLNLSLLANNMHRITIAFYHIDISNTIFYRIYYVSEI